MITVFRLNYSNYNYRTMTEANKPLNTEQQAAEEEKSGAAKKVGKFNHGDHMVHILIQ